VSGSEGCHTAEKGVDTRPVPSPSVFFKMGRRYDGVHTVCEQVAYSFKCFKKKKSSVVVFVSDVLISDI